MLKIVMGVIDFDWRKPEEAKARAMEITQAYLSQGSILLDAATNYYAAKAAAMKYKFLTTHGENNGEGRRLLRKHLAAERRSLEFHHRYEGGALDSFLD